MIPQKLVSQTPKPLTIFKLVMMTVIAIDSLKNLPANAQYGSSLLFFYFIAAITFFIPSALVAAELATTWPETGGIYVWVREAFGKRTAFLAVWMQWLFMVIWYPTILSFIAVTATYFIYPELAVNKSYVLTTILAIFWLATFLNCKGLKISSFIGAISAIFGVIVPMIFIIILGIFWIYSGHNSQIHFSIDSFTVNLFTTDNFRLFITLLFSLMGMEMIAVHAADVKNPQKNYPRALIAAMIIILLTAIPASLAIAVVIPNKQIGLTSGVVEGFMIFLTAFHLSWLKFFVIVAVIIGCFGIFLTWLLAAVRCLLIAAYDKSLPQFLIKTNQSNMPVALLITQGIIFSLLCIAFVMMPSVNSAFWLLTAASSQLALIYYLFLFIAALRLRYKKPDIVRPFRAGRHPSIIWIVCLVAIATCIISIGFGFLPPPEISCCNVAWYEIFLGGLIVASISGALIIYYLCQSNIKKNSVYETIN